MVTLFNFQGSVASELSFSSFSILSHRLRFVKSFFKIFSIFIFELVFRDFSATAYLFYHIEFRLSSFIFDFFKSFFACLAFRLSQICAQFPSVGRLSVSLLPVSLRQLHYLTTPAAVCQLLFSLFFDVFLPL